MKLTKIVTSACVTALGFSLTGGIVNAAVTVLDDLNVSTTGTVELEADDTTPITPPVTEPVDPDGITGNTGPLRIDIAPSFDFGVQKINPVSQTYPVIPGENAQSETYKILAQITDVRGTGSGWDLQARMSKVFEDVVGNHTLNGAVITLGTGTLLTTLENESTTPGFVMAGFDLNNQFQSIMTADADEGLGPWATQLDAAGTELTIPGGGYAGSYEAEIEWVLSSTGDTGGSEINLDGDNVAWTSAEALAFANETAMKDGIIAAANVTIVDGEGAPLVLPVTITDDLDASLLAGVAGDYVVTLHAGTATLTITVTVTA